MNNKLQIVLAGIMILTAVAAFESRYLKSIDGPKFAKATDLKAVKNNVRLVEMRLEQKIINDRLHDLESRAARLEDKHKGNDCTIWPNSQDRTTYRMLLRQIKDIERQYNLLLKNSHIKNGGG